MLQHAGIALPGIGTSSTEENLPWCNIPLPIKKPFAPKDSEVKERLFIVSSPDSFSDDLLEEVLCRFGDMISAYFMPGNFVLCYLTCMRVLFFIQDFYYNSIDFE